MEGGGREEGRLACRREGGKEGGREKLYAGEKTFQDTKCHSSANTTADEMSTTGRGLTDDLSTASGRQLSEPVRYSPASPSSRGTGLDRVR